MGRINASEPNVFGYTNHVDKKNTAKNAAASNTTTAPVTNDINRDIIIATKAIQASVANTNSNKTAYLVSGLSLLIIAALAYQNSLMAADRKEMSDLIQKLNPGAGFSSPLYDGGPSNELCLDILLQRPNDTKHMLFGTKFANFQSLIGKSEREQVNYLSEVLSELPVQTPNGDSITLHNVSRLRALILSHCTTTFTNFEDLLPQFSVETLNDALLASSDVANYDEFKKIKAALKQNGVDPKNLPFSYAMSQTDPKMAKDLRMRVQVIMGEDEVYHAFDSQQNVATNGYANPKHSILNGLFQQKLVQDEDYTLYLEGRVQNLLESGDQNRLKLFLNNYPSPLEEPVLQRVIEKLNLIQNENGDWVVNPALTQAKTAEPHAEGSQQP